METTKGNTHEGENQLEKQWKNISEKSRKLQLYVFELEKELALKDIDIDEKSNLILDLIYDMEELKTTKDNKIKELEAIIYNQGDDSKRQLLLQQKLETTNKKKRHLTEQVEELKQKISLKDYNYQKLLLEENAKTEELIVQEEDKKYLQYSILMEKKFSRDLDTYSLNMEEKIVWLEKKFNKELNTKNIYIDSLKERIAKLSIDKSKQE